MNQQANPRTAVLQPAPDLSVAARQWSERLAVPVLEPPAADDYDLWLQLQADAAAPGYRLSLQVNASPAPGPVMVDFVGGALGHRRRFGGGRGQPLARAIGLKHGAAPQVLDLTAGLGRDAFVLASLGCTVRMVERVALVAALLENALARAADDPEVGAIVARMELIGADALQWLAAMPATDRPDVVYLDPMYPQRRKQALVKKEMQLFHRLVGADADAPVLLAAALRRAGKRVVVKRPRTAPALEGPAPQFSIKSPNTRYDVYPLT